MNITIDKDNKASFDYTLTSTDVDGFSAARLMAYEDFVQEVAARHATVRGLGIYDLVKEGRTWVIARSRMEIQGYAYWLDDITQRNWAQDSTGFNCPRHIEAVRSDGKPLFSCSTKWAVIDMKTGRPQKASLIGEALGVPPRELQGESKLPSIIEEEEKRQLVMTRHIPQIRYLDSDLNRHVNNINYINWCLDALPFEFRDEYKPSLVNVRWIKQCHRHDNLTVIVRAQDNEEFKKEEPSFWFDIMRTDDSGASTKVFDAFICFRRRSLMSLEPAWR